MCLCALEHKGLIYIAAFTNTHLYEQFLSVESICLVLPQTHSLGPSLLDNVTHLCVTPGHYRHRPDVAGTEQASHG